MKKYSFRYEGKTGIAESKGFQKKLLGELSCNIGNVCELGCTFCYLTPKEAAKYTSINLGTLNNWRSEWDEKKVGPSFIRLKGSNKILHDLLVLDRYMQENEVS